MLELKCIREDFFGNGIVIYKDEEKKIPGLMEGEIGLFEAVKNGKYTNLHLLEIKKVSPDRVEPKCPIYKECGGCQFLHTTYNHELKIKTDYLKDLFKTSRTVKISDVIPIDSPFSYRDKCQMTYKLSKSKKVVCGFYEEKSHKVVPITNCMIQSDKATAVIEGINKALTKNKIQPYDEHTGRGVVRHVVIRIGEFTNEIMVSLVTNGEMFPGRKNVVTDILKQNLGITTIVQNYNDRDTSIVMGDRERVLYGPGFIYDKIDEYKFKLSSKSFYQVNPNGMKKLYKKAIESLGIKKTDIVLDAYSGVGTIGILMSKMAREVYSVELNKDAYKDAIINAKLNNIKNIKFFNEDSTRFIQNLAKNRVHIDLLVLDPPREGSTKEFINAVGALKPKKVVYVSCEPKSLQRDLYDFTKNDYKIVSIDSVDMFPRTSNLETICLLNRKNG
ncbi:MAG: 23S rRNA (uracil(1939)-C(5))-methyltransferase RlmD [Acholeplasmatales bacterium]|nr:23S rRNA (uracil(1939)-C(5))-methyltransferase RlmD [Acholeplasmatales bacterium]